MRKIVVTNDKGGVGKTTTVANLSVGLAQQGYKTLVVDMDPQGDVTYAILGKRPPLLTRNKPLPRTIYSLLLNKYDFGEVRIKAPRYPNLDVLPSNNDLAGAAGQLASEPGAQTVLLRVLQSLPENTYDYVLIDTGKGLGLLVINALAAADEVIVMTSPGKLEFDAVVRMMDHVEKVRLQTLLGAERPQVLGILVTNVDDYTVSRDTKALIQKRYPGLLLETEIRKNDDLKKAISRALSVFEFNPRSTGAQAYEMLVKEVAANGR